MLIAALEDVQAHWEIRAHAARSLGNLKAKDAAEPLGRALLGATDERIRVQCARSLGVIADESGIEPLRAAASDPSDVVRAYAAEALGSFRAPEVVDLLVGCLRDPRRIVRLDAAAALVRINDPRAIEALEQAARREPWLTRRVVRRAAEQLAARHESSEHPAA